MKVPTGPGSAPGLWLHRVDSGFNIPEIYMSEVRTALPRQAEVNHHMWKNTGPIPPGAKASDHNKHWQMSGKRFDVGLIPGVWHTWGVRVGDFATTYLIDGKVVKVAPGVPRGSWYGALIQMFPGKPGSWIAGYPDVKNPVGPRGPANLAVDKVEVTRP